MGLLLIHDVIECIAGIHPARWAIVNGKLYLNNGFVAHSLWSLNKRANRSRRQELGGFPEAALANVTELNRTELSFARGRKSRIVATGRASASIVGKGSP